MEENQGLAKLSTSSTAGWSAACLVPQLTTASRITRTSVRSWVRVQVQTSVAPRRPHILRLCISLDVSVFYFTSIFLALFFFKMAENMSVFLF
jgi:hypothetical protein